jgi:hypothetical protein
LEKLPVDEMVDKTAVEFNAVDKAVGKPYDGDGDGKLSGKYLLLNWKM